MMERFDLVYILKYEGEKLYDACRRLRYSIDSLRDQPVRVIIVNYSENDLPWELLPRIELKYHHHPVRNFFSRSRSINFAVKNYVDTEYFVVSDIDLIYQPGHFSSLLSMVRDSDVKLRIVTYNYNIQTEDKEKYSSDVNELKKLRLSTGGYAHGNGVIHLDSFKAIHGYDEYFVGYGPEDDLFNCRISRINSLVFQPDRRLATYHLWHEVNSFDESLFEKNMKYWIEQKKRLYGKMNIDLTDLVQNELEWGRLN